MTSSSAFGRVLTGVNLTIDPATGDVTTAVAKNLLVVRNDPAITADLSNGRSDGACNMPAGNLIADSQLAATQPATFGSAVVAFMNGGGVRSPGFKCRCGVLCLASPGLHPRKKTLPPSKIS